MELMVNGIEVSGGLGHGGIDFEDAPTKSGAGGLSAGWGGLALIWQTCPDWGGFEAAGVVGFGIMEKDVRSLMGWRTSFVFVMVSGWAG